MAPVFDDMQRTRRIPQNGSGQMRENLLEYGNILISTHAIAMKGILEYLTPDSKGAYWSKFIGNCAVYAVECTDGKIGIPKEWMRKEG